MSAILAKGWSIDAPELTYVPKGVGAYHWRVTGNDHEQCFVTVDDLDTKPWLGREPSATFEGLVAAYATAWILHHEDGLALVVRRSREPATV